MAAAAKVFFLFVASIALILQANAASDLVHEWCGRTENNDLCVSIIEDDPRTNLRNSPNGICEILTDRYLADAITIGRKISDILKKATNLYGVQCLQECSELNDRAITKLSSVDFTVIDQKNYLSMAVDVGNGYDGPQDCEECFTERPGTPPSQLTSDNQHLRDIAITIGSIINLVVCNKAVACVG